MKKARTTYLSKAQIEQAIAATRSNRAAASHLRVSYNLYKKFAKMFTNSEGVTLFDSHLNRGGRGVVKPRENKTKFKLDQILMGKHPTYPREKLFRRIIQSKYMEEKCSHCGYCQKRATDLKSPLILHHINGNNKDHTITNLEILCFNCYYVLVGNISSKDIRYNVKVGVDTNVKYTAITETVQDETSTNEQQEFGNVLTDQEKIDIINKIKGL